MTPASEWTPKRLPRSSTAGRPAATVRTARGRGLRAAMRPRAARATARWSFDWTAARAASPSARRPAGSSCTARSAAGSGATAGRPMAAASSTTRLRMPAGVAATTASAAA